MSVQSKNEPQPGASNIHIHVGSTDEPGTEKSPTRDPKQLDTTNKEQTSTSTPDQKARSEGVDETETKPPEFEYDEDLEIAPGVKAGYSYQSAIHTDSHKPLEDDAPTDIRASEHWKFTDPELVQHGHF